MPLSPLENKDALLSFFKEAEKKVTALKIGTEHEVFLVDAKTLQRATSEQISGLLENWSTFKGEGTPLCEGAYTIGLNKNNSSLSLEPGGQFELSGAPLDTLHETAYEIRHHQGLLSRLAQQHQLLILPIGADPFSDLSERPWMPKARYRIMRPYMATKGRHGHEMMTGTCTVQVNLDYVSEQDMVKKMRVGMALQPLVTALFAHSPLSKGRPNGYQSIRRFFWRDTDPDRCGMLPFVFEDSMGYERYIDYALSVPMYFVRRQGRYLNVAGTPFKDFLEGLCKALPGEKPTLEDWSDHLTTLFPEVRLKQFIEMRGADSGPFPNLMALPSFWVGLLYSAKSLSDSETLLQSWPLQDILELSNRVDKEGLHALFQGRSLFDIGKEVLDLSHQGLLSRNLGEEKYLEPLFTLIDLRQSFSDQALAQFRHNPDPLSFIQSFNKDD